MKSSKTTSSQNKQGLYVPPALDVIDITIEQNILADGSANGMLDDMQGERW
jgi:hypothetical protein